tara:strand:+ start:1085 stop:2371 length:1287 start_codon:yes stop_codon:yes gene_type:complete
MASTYTANTGIEKIASGEQAGTWGTTTNRNFDIIDDALNGVLSLAISGNTTLTTSDGTLSNGHHKVILLTDSVSSAFNLTIAPNDQQKWYFINNNTDQICTALQGGGSGTTVAIGAGASAIIYADGTGANANVATVSTDVLGDSSPQLGGNLDVNGKNINFGDAATAGSDDTLQFGASQDLKIYHDGSNSYIDDSGTGALAIRSNDLLLQKYTGETMGRFLADGAASLFHNGDVKIATTSTGVTVTGNITNTSGDMTIDVAGEIILDSDGADIIFKDAGTEIGRFSNTASNFVMKSAISDKDLIFKGNDGGSEITALTLDMSAAGAATFNNDVTAFSDRRLKTDIEPITNALPKVMQMQGVYYKRNDVEDAREQVGVIAQDMEAIVPEVVLTADDDMQTKSVDYGKLCAVLIESIKELKAEIDELKKN